jgi:ATP synthase protein I
MHESKKLMDESKKGSKGPGLLLISVGTVLTSMVVAGFLLGYLLDTWLGTLPIFMLGLGVLGFVGGILKVYRLLNDPNLQ